MSGAWYLLLLLLPDVLPLLLLLPMAARSVDARLLSPPAGRSCSPLVCLCSCIGA